ncbi:REP-associated tyrosine transposase [Anaerosalibacter sp. Marseille-P3206]|uniref:REP-associated tyrosine transposase n=1 Tax=Anaerosalibacter sp. Marseille-P3206 TaxID=1871005 RepID=UPI000987C1A6|nr:transposase [Anaerosalibacter sp. Marseille-P3206]
MRMPRQKSQTYVYHIMVRGNEKKKIFLDDEDREKLLDIISLKSNNNEFCIYAYCLMDNHIHLIMKEISEDISTIMSKINTTYAFYFNKKYDRVGHVFQGRFKSEPIETEEYLLTAVRYVHNNPVKAKIVKKREDYIWSSYRSYLSETYALDCLNTDFVLSLFSQCNSKAMILFKEYSRLENEDEFIDIQDFEIIERKNLKTPEEVEDFTEEFLDKNKISFDELMKNRKNIKLRNRLIYEIKTQSNFSNRDLENILGINRNIIQRVK